MSGLPKQLIFNSADMINTIAIFLIDDHPVSISGVKIMLRNQNISVTGSAQSIDEFLNKAKKYEFQVLLLDLYLPGTHPVDNIKKIRERFPLTPIVVFTSEDDEQWHRQMMGLGISGYVVKNAPRDELIFVIKKAASGEICSVTKQHEILTNGTQNPKVLTNNQIEILRMVAKGKSQEEISKIKYTTVSNIEKTMQNIRRKLNFKTTFQVIKYCTDHGYLR